MFNSMLMLTTKKTWKLPITCTLWGHQPDSPHKGPAPGGQQCGLVFPCHDVQCDITCPSRVYMQDLLSWLLGHRGDCRPVWKDIGASDILLHIQLNLCCYCHITSIVLITLDILINAIDFGQDHFIRHGFYDNLVVPPFFKPFTT